MGRMQLVSPGRALGDYERAGRPNRKDTTAARATRAKVSSSVASPDWRTSRRRTRGCSRSSEALAAATPSDATRGASIAVAATGWLLPEGAPVRSRPLAADSVADRAGPVAAAARLSAFGLFCGAARPLVAACVILGAATREAALGFRDTLFAAAPRGFGPGSLGWALGETPWTLAG
jgi:hypothetical protein